MLDYRAPRRKLKPKLELSRDVGIEEQIKAFITDRTHSYRGWQVTSAAYGLIKVEDGRRDIFVRMGQTSAAKIVAERKIGDGEEEAAERKFDWYVEALRLVLAYIDRVEGGEVTRFPAYLNA